MKSNFGNFRSFFYVSQFSLGGILFLASAPVIALSLNSALVAANSRSMSVRDVSGNVTYGGNATRKGDSFSASQKELRTGKGGRASLAIDDGDVGNISIAENTNLRVTNLSSSSRGGRNTQLAMSQGRVRVQVRKFNNPDSGFSINTPTGSVGVRGTDFGVVVLPGGETRVSAVNGIVDVQANNRTVVLEGGYSTVISPGRPPLTPVLATGDVKVSYTVLPNGTNDKVRVTGSANPIDFVFLNGRTLALNSKGEFNTSLPIPVNRQLQVVVQNPLGEKITYNLQLNK
jgi:FecR protein